MVSELPVAEVLARDYGFQVTTLLDGEATRDRILGALNGARKQLGADDSFLVYYSGHGQFDSKTETSYWIPVDADAEDKANEYASDCLLEVLDEVIHELSHFEPAIPDN